MSSPLLAFYRSLDLVLLPARVVTSVEYWTHPGPSWPIQYQKPVQKRNLLEDEKCSFIFKWPASSQYFAHFFRWLTLAPFSWIPMQPVPFSPTINVKMFNWFLALWAWISNIKWNVALALRLSPLSRYAKIFIWLILLSVEHSRLF